MDPQRPIFGALLASKSGAEEGGPNGYLRLVSTLHRDLSETALKDTRPQPRGALGARVVHQLLTLEIEEGAGNAG
jgi:hypothetical protein